MYEILLPSARHLEEWPTVSQSVSQAGQQSGRQAGKNTQFGFFSVADYDYKTPCMQEHSVVEWSNTRPMVRLAPV